MDQDVTNHRRKNIHTNLFSHKEVIMQQEDELLKNTGVIEKISWKRGTKLKTNQQENKRRNL
jgi:hypothetical protein